MTDARDLLKMAKAARDATNELERLALLRDLEEAATQARRETLLLALKATDGPTVARHLGISSTAVYLQAKHARQGS